MKKQFLKLRKMVSTEPIMKIQMVRTAHLSGCSEMTPTITWQSAARNGYIKTE